MLSIHNLPDQQRLRAFLAVARYLNFRIAAEHLHIAQPAVSRAVKTLEEELGFKLLERTTRRVELTPAGDVLAQQIEAAFGQIQQAVRLAKMTSAGMAGTLMLGYSTLTVYGLISQAVVQFRGKVPDADVSLYLMSSHEQLAAISDGTIDVGLLLSAAVDGSCQHAQLYRERLVVLVAKSDPIARRSSVSVKDLRDIPFVLGSHARWGPFRSVVDSVCLTAGFLPKVAEHGDDMPVLLRLVSLRRGVTLFAESVKGSLPPDIAAVPIQDEHAVLDVSVAWRNGPPSPLLETFLESVKDTAARTAVAPKSVVRATRPGRRRREG